MGAFAKSYLNPTGKLDKALFKQIIDEYPDVIEKVACLKKA